MEPDIKLAPLLAVKTVEPADRIMSLKDTYLFPEMSQTDARSQTGHAGSNYHNIVVGVCIQMLEVVLKDN